MFRLYVYFSLFSPTPFFPGRFFFPFRYMLSWYIMYILHWIFLTINQASKGWCCLCWRCWLGETSWSQVTSDCGLCFNTVWWYYLVVFINGSYFLNNWYLSTSATITGYFTYSDLGSFAVNGGTRWSAWSVATERSLLSSKWKCLQGGTAQKCLITGKLNRPTNLLEELTSDEEHNPLTF